MVENASIALTRESARGPAPGQYCFASTQVRSFIRRFHMLVLRYIASCFRGCKRRPKLATSRRGLSRPRRNQLSPEALEARDVPSAVHPTLQRFIPSNSVAPLGTLGPTGLTPAQVRHAYGFDQIMFAGGVVG